MLERRLGWSLGKQRRSMLLQDAWRAKMHEGHHKKEDAITPHKNQFVHGPHGDTAVEVYRRTFPDTAALVDEYNEHDMHLYEWAVARFDKEMQEMPPMVPPLMEALSADDGSRDESRDVSRTAVNKAANGRNSNRYRMDQAEEAVAEEAIAAYIRTSRNQRDEGLKRRPVVHRTLDQSRIGRQSRAKQFLEQQRRIINWTDTGGYDW
eukprot:7214555-Pyramimonas_sp.AAC.2